MRHVLTDPTCVRHRPPRTWWGRWRFDRARGLVCHACRDRELVVEHVPECNDGCVGDDHLLLGSVERGRQVAADLEAYRRATGRS